MTSYTSTNSPGFRSALALRSVICLLANAAARRSAAISSVVLLMGLAPLVGDDALRVTAEGSKARPGAEVRR
jgi:hypothetical protein